MHHEHGDGQAPWMPECRNANKKFSPASLVFRQFITLSPASAFRHRGQSGTASHGLVRQCPAMAICSYTCTRTATFSMRQNCVLFIRTNYVLIKTFMIGRYKCYFVKAKLFVSLKTVLDIFKSSCRNTFFLPQRTVLIYTQNVKPTETKMIYLVLKILILYNSVAA